MTNTKPATQSETLPAKTLPLSRPATVWVEAEVKCETCFGTGLVYAYGRGEDGDELECDDCDASGVVVEWVAQ